MMQEEIKRPLILVTNDDGVSAKGIKSLVNAIKDFATVCVVAPDSARSGQSSAITPNKALTLCKLEDTENLKIYSTNGTPVDCVKLAMNKIFDRKPDLLVSGINHGSNAGVSILYSGTMGAVLEGCVLGIPSIGFSLCNYDQDANFTTSQVFARKIVEEVLINKLQPGVCLNVNIPDLQVIEGIRICRQTSGFWTKEFESRLDESGNECFWLTGFFNNLEPEAQDTDEWALANGYVSVVPCHIDMTSYQAIPCLNYLQDSFNK